MGYQDTFFRQQNLTLMGTLPIKLLQSTMVFSLPIHNIHCWGISSDLLHLLTICLLSLDFNFPEIMYFSESTVRALKSVLCST